MSDSAIRPEIHRRGLLYCREEFNQQEERRREEKEREHGGSKKTQLDVQRSFRFNFLLRTYFLSERSQCLVTIGKWVPSMARVFVRDGMDKRKGVEDGEV